MSWLPGAPGMGGGLVGAVEEEGGRVDVPGSGRPVLGVGARAGAGVVVSEGAGVIPGFVFVGEREGTEGEDGGKMAGLGEGTLPGTEEGLSVAAAGVTACGTGVAGEGNPGEVLPLLEKGDLVTLNLGGVEPGPAWGGVTPLGVNFNPVAPGVGGGGGGGGGAGIKVASKVEER